MFMIQVNKTSSPRCPSMTVSGKCPSHNMHWHPAMRLIWRKIRCATLEIFCRLSLLGLKHEEAW